MSKHIGNKIVTCKQINISVIVTMTKKCINSEKCVICLGNSIQKDLIILFKYDVS